MIARPDVLDWMRRAPPGLILLSGIDVPREVSLLDLELVVERVSVDGRTHLVPVGGRSVGWMEPGDVTDRAGDLDGHIRSLAEYPTAPECGVELAAWIDEIVLWAVPPGFTMGCDRLLLPPETLPCVTLTLLSLEVSPARADRLLRRLLEGIDRRARIEGWPTILTNGGFHRARADGTSAHAEAAR